MSGHQLVAPPARRPDARALPDDLVGVLRLIALRTERVEVEVCGRCGSLERADRQCVVCKLRRLS
jgi:hypothetical protein